MLTAFVIEPENIMRTKLRQALAASDVYGRSIVATSLNEATRLFKDMEESIDVVFISANFGDMNAQSFYESSKKLKPLNDAAFILVFRGDVSYAPTLASNLIGGADGFLIAPFSVAGVSDTAKIAMRVKRQNADLRLSAAAGVVVDSMISEVDRRAKRKADGKQVPKVRKDLLEAGKQFKLVAGDSIDNFYDTAVERFSAIEAPESDGSGYQGPSMRVKKMIEEAEEDVEEVSESEGNQESD